MVAHRGHATYLFISRNKKKVYRTINPNCPAIILNLSRDNLNLSNDTLRIIAQ